VTLLAIEPLRASGRRHGVGARLQTRHVTPSVLELRQYSLKPGRRYDLAALFERHFVEALEATGMEVPGLFEDLDDADRLVWWRSFSDMASRRRALADFYLDGSVWRRHGAAANATMVDSDDVLLLAPAYFGEGYPGLRDDDEQVRLRALPGSRIW